MSKATTVFEGFAAEPKTRVSQQGKRLLDISVAHTPRRFNKQTNEWEDELDRDGEKITTWAQATFFDEMATHLASVVSKGTEVRIEGEPRLSAYIDNSGKPRPSLELRFARLTLVPRPPRQDGPGTSSGAPEGQSAWGQPAGAQNSFDDEQPF
ncbi:single-stranded DNA-binding protein [Leucobacter viscericola]|uniref:Single-stranded DNA-binding protein n=1 Tax=Leucobacter viscericola TaxID=2714935 RepID=A0A6G7XGY9_9MICO|nr:single-stranded DNA-binding protein [Leucobacter viscericola]QIK63813.1 single-stranded DNA-binding protein [Leucobacter viscericola]